MRVNEGDTMKRIALLAAAALLWVAPASAQIYIEGNVGASFVSDSDFDGNIAGTPFSGKSEFDNTWVVGGALGYRFTRNIRAEFNLSYRNADIDSATFDGVGTVEGAGDVSALTGMVNVYYDFATGSKFRPYIGAGLGFARIELDSDANAAMVSNDSDTVFAWNLMAGIAYAVSDNAEITLGYRYLGSQDVSLDVSVPALGGATGSMDAEFDTHEVLIGLRYTF